MYITSRTYHERDDPDDDDPEGVVEAIGYTSKCLTAYDTVEDQKALHREDSKRAGNDRAIISTNDCGQYSYTPVEYGVTYPHE